MEQTPYLTIVIPAYNEVALIEQTLDLVANFLAERNLSAEVLVVDDGSTVGTADLSEAALKRLGLCGRVLRQNSNVGKGAAVQRGMREGKGQLLLMTDADLSTPLEEYEKLAKALAAGADIAIASRGLKQSRLEPPQPWWRQSLGKLYGLVRRLILLPRVVDTQCGFKLFTAEAAHEVFSRQTISGWAFDAEILYIACLLGYRIVEVPVTWRNRRESKVRIFRDVWRVLRDLLAVRFRHRHLARSRRRSENS